MAESDRTAPEVADPTDIQPTDVSVIVPAHAADAKFAACLQGLAALDPAPGEILVAVDGEAGDSVVETVETVGELAQTGSVGIRALPSPGRTGPAAARNRGAATATGTVLFFVDSDVVVPPDAVERLCSVWRRHPSAAATFGSYDDEPHDPGFISQFTNLLHHFVHQASDEDSSTFWAGCGAVRTSWFHHVGGFDEGYDRPAIEDIELGYRLHAAGGKIVVDPTLQVKHLKRWTFTSMVRTHIFDRAWPWTQLILSRGQLDDNLNTDRKSRLAGVAATLLALVLLLAPFVPALLFFAPVPILVLLVLERNLYRFFYRRRGPVFTVGAVLLHWLYLLYSSLTFGLGLLWHLVSKRRVKRAPDAKGPGTTE